MTTPVLWNKNIDDIKDSGYLSEGKTITDALIENFYGEILKDEEKKLIKLMFSENPTQEKLDDLLKEWDIEVKHSAKNLLLAYFMKSYPNLKFSAYEEPRLKGLLSNLRFKNLQTVAHFVKIGKLLNENGITPMIFKGGAMKFLRQDLPRVMGDIDILVESKNFRKTIDLACTLGYYYERIFDHSADLYDEKTHVDALDVHRFIDFQGTRDKQISALFLKRAQQKQIFGIKALIPSAEDLLFIILVNLSRNLRAKTSQAGILFSIFDADFLIKSKPDFDWNIIRENAKYAHLEVQLDFAVKFIEKLGLGVISKDVQKMLQFDKETNDYSTTVIFNRFYLQELRTKCRSLKFNDMLKNPKLIKDYIFLKPKYLFLKLLREHAGLINFFIKDLNKIYEDLNSDIN